MNTPKNSSPATIQDITRYARKYGFIPNTVINNINKNNEKLVEQGKKPEALSILAANHAIRRLNYKAGIGSTVAPRVTKKK